MKILVINCGSSSLKYQLIDMENEGVLAIGLCERIGIAGSKLTHKSEGNEDMVVEKEMPNHTVAIKLVLDALVDPKYGVIKDTSEISAVGHRVLHAGTIYSDSIVVNEDVKKVIRDCFDLGPLHNPANLMGIEACEEAVPLSVWVCLTKPVCMQFLMNIMRNTAFAVTVSMEQATNLYPTKP